LSGAKHRRKGSRVEREICAKHVEIGVPAKRVPLSGAQAGYPGDVEITLPDGALMGEVKARKSGGGFVTLEKWLGANGVLFLRRDNAEPIVLLPWSTWARVLRRPT
jgi:Holliday junction resolvase